MRKYRQTTNFCSHCDGGDGGGGPPITIIQAKTDCCRYFLARARTNYLNSSNYTHTHTTPHNKIKTHVFFFTFGRLNRAAAQFSTIILLVFDAIQHKIKTIIDFGHITLKHAPERVRRSNNRANGCHDSENSPCQHSGLGGTTTAIQRLHIV